MIEYIRLIILGFIFLWIFLMGFSVIKYNCFERDRFKAYPLQQSGLWRSRMNAGGHGLVYNKETNSIGNSVEPNECAERIKYYEDNRDKIFKSLTLQYFAKESIDNIVLAFGVSFVGCLFLFGLFLFY